MRSMWVFKINPICALLQYSDNNAIKHRLNPMRNVGDMCYY